MQFFTLFASIVIDVDATAIIMGVVFVLVYFILGPLVIQPYLKIRDEREEGTEGSMEDAVELEDKALRARDHYEQELRDIRKEAGEVRDSLREQGAHEQADMLEEVRVELMAKLETERSALTAQLEDAQAKLKAKADGLADSIVSKVMPGA